MKKIIALVWVWLLVLTVAGFSQPSGLNTYDYPRLQSGVNVFGEITSSDVSILNRVRFRFRLRVLGGIVFGVRVGTRGANDSLTVTVQTSPDPTDSSLWQSLTDIGGRKVVVGNSVFRIPTAVGARDSVAALFDYVRVLVRHSETVAGINVADTSSIRLFVKEF